MNLLTDNIKAEIKKAIVNLIKKDGLPMNRDVDFGSGWIDDSAKSKTLSYDEIIDVVDPIIKDIEDEDDTLFDEVNVVINELIDNDEILQFVDDAGNAYYFTESSDVELEEDLAALREIFLDMIEIPESRLVEVKKAFENGDVYISFSTYNGNVCFSSYVKESRTGSIRVSDHEANSYAGEKSHSSVKVSTIRELIEKVSKLECGEAEINEDGEFVEV